MADQQEEIMVNMEEQGENRRLEADIKEGVEKMTGQFKSDILENIADFKEYVQIQFTNKNRRENDFNSQKEKLNRTVYGFQGEMDNILNKMALLTESLAYVKEILKIQSAINL